MTLQRSSLATPPCSLQTLLLQFYCRLSIAKIFLLYSLSAVSFHGTVSFRKYTVCCTSDNNNKADFKVVLTISFGIIGFFSPKSASLCPLPSLAGVHAEYSASKCSYGTVKMLWCSCENSYSFLPVLTLTAAQNWPHMSQLNANDSDF